MLQVTEKASEKIKDFLKDKEGPANIRVFLAQGG
jgi:Fe-S cluster assembly iron-binding protein IscA